MLVSLFKFVDYQQLQRYSYRRAVDGCSCLLAMGQGVGENCEISIRRNHVGSVVCLPIAGVADHAAKCLNAPVSSLASNWLHSARRKRSDVRAFLRSTCSVQFKMVSMRSEKPICARPRLSEVSPKLPLKRFQC